jgi:DNA-binding PadR family transcriptional regulator
MGIVKKVLDVLRKNPTTVNEIAERAGLSYGVAYITLERRRLTGQVRRDRRTGRGGFLYRITELGVKWLKWSRDQSNPTIESMFDEMRGGVLRFLGRIESVPLKRLDLIEDDSGIYFIYEHDEIVYIGSAQNLPTRLGDHLSGKKSKLKKKKDWTVKHIVAKSPFDEISLRRVEDWLVLAFQPKYNTEPHHW